MIEPDFSVDSAAPEGQSAPETENKGTDTQEANNQGDIPELDKFERVKWEGKDWSLKDLKNSVLMHSDYSRKTQEISEERKFYDNLRYDLDAIRKNPDLESKFKELYPEKFHSYLDYVRTGQKVPDAQLVSRLDQIEKM